MARWKSPEAAARLQRRRRIERRENALALTVAILTMLVGLYGYYLLAANGFLSHKHHKKSSKGNEAVMTKKME